MDRSSEVRARLRKLFSKQALPPWLIVAFDRIVWIVERGGDVDFVATYGPVAWALLREWSWAVGVIWLGYLLIRPSPAFTVTPGRNLPALRASSETENAGLHLSGMSAQDFAQYASDLDAEWAEFHRARYDELPKESDIEWPEGDTDDDKHDARLLFDNFTKAESFHRSETEAQFRSRFKGRILAVAKEAMRRGLAQEDALAQCTKRHHYTALLTDIAERAHEATKP